MPWVFIRRTLAARWHIPPWEVDDAPWDEINRELEIAEIIEIERRE